MCIAMHQTALRPGEATKMELNDVTLPEEAIMLQPTEKALIRVAPGGRPAKVGNRGYRVASIEDPSEKTPSREAVPEERRGVYTGMEESSGPEEPGCAKDNTARSKGGVADGSLPWRDGRS